MSAQSFEGIDIELNLMGDGPKNLEMRSPNSSSGYSRFLSRVTRVINTSFQTTTEICQIMGFSMWSTFLWGLMSLKRKMKFLLKLLILGLALWMIVDEGLDGNQTRVYYINSMGGNNDTRPFCNETLLMECWFDCSIPSCREVLNITSLDSANKCEISQLNCKLRLHWAYFACALAAWILPPVIFAIVLTYAKYQPPLLHLPGYKHPPHAYIRYTGWEMHKRRAMKIASTALLFSAHVMLGFPVVYVKLPVDAMLFALANLGYIRKDRMEYDRNWTFLKIDSDIILDIQNRVMKLFEQFGEAIPQLLLTVTYYLNNVYYIWWTETILPIPTTLISIIFSMGSVLMGLITGFTAGRDVAFIRAVKTGNLRRINCLAHLKYLKVGVDPNVDIDKMGNTPLHNAASRGDVKVLKSLICLNAQLNSQDQSGQTPLHKLLSSTSIVNHRAVHYEGHRRKAVHCLIHSGAELEIEDQDGRTALHYASFGGHVEEAKILINAGSELNIQDKKGRTALHYASYYSHAEVVDSLIMASTDVNRQDDDGSTALHHASRHGNTGMVKSLVKKGADINTPNKLGVTALHKASLRGHVEVVTILILAGAEVNTTDTKDIKGGIYRGTPLYLASGRGRVEVVKSLIEAGAEVNRQASQDNGNTALHIASWKGNIEVVEHLIKNGAEVNKLKVELNSATDAWTALHFATDMGHVEVVNYLIQAGADVNLHNPRGSMPLHKASQMGHVDIVTSLFLAGANVEARNGDGKTALDLVTEKLLSTANTQEVTEKYAKIKDILTRPL